MQGQNVAETECLHGWQPQASNGFGGVGKSVTALISIEVRVGQLACPDAIQYDKDHALQKYLIEGLRREAQEAISV